MECGLIPNNLRVNNLIIEDSAEFTFSGVFREDIDQKDLFQKAASKLVLRCLEGYNGTIFAYGQTGAGKTYTMSGNGN